MREHILLQIHTNPSQGQALSLVDGDGKGHTDGQLAPLQLEGAHVLVEFGTANGYLPARTGPVQHSGPDRVLQKLRDHHPGAVGDALGEVPQRNDGAPTLSRIT